MVEEEDFDYIIKRNEKCCYIISNIISRIGGDIRDGIEDFLYDNNIDESWNTYFIVNNDYDNIKLESNSSLYEVVVYDLEKCLYILKANDDIRDRFLNIENKYMNKVKNLNNMKISELIEFYYDDFYENLIEYICASQSEFQKDRNEILKHKLELFFNDKTKSINYFKLLFTHKLVNSHTQELLDAKIDFIDLSFSILPLYKLVEITLFDLIKIKYPNDYITIYDSKNNRNINHKICEVDKHKMMLNVMKTFLVKKNFFKNDTLLYNYITNLEKWIKEDRNGYVHKDIMKIDDYKSIDTNSINLFCMIIYNL